MESKKPIGETFGYIDINSIDNKKHKITEPKYLRVVDAPSRANRGVETGATLFSMVRPYLENIAYVDAKYSNCIASTGFFVCQPMKVLYSKYLYYLMLSSYVINGLNDFMKGDNSPSINNENITSYVFPLPPLPEQHRIVSQIEMIFNQLDAIEQSIKA
jgi:type I restriction enzyme S subunit